MKFHLLIFILIIFIFILFSQSIDIKCNHSSRLGEYERDIITRYITTEYETAINYLDDIDTIHFYMIDTKNDILISYFHITQSNHKYFINYAYTNEKYRNKGYMKKLLSYSLDVCKDLNIEKVYSWTKLTNKNSQKLFTSMKFQTHSIKDENITFVIYL
jgi:GNAT superfamily N-acetyltransferase